MTNENDSTGNESAESLDTVMAEGPSRGPKEVVWGDGRKPDPNRICSAHRTNGKPCRKTALRGTQPPLCVSHGAGAPAVRRKARVRLEMAADRMAKELLGIAIDSDTPPAVKLAAIRDSLDRAGLSAKTAVEVEVGPTKAFESILASMVSGGSRAESRSRRGEPDEGPSDGWIADELDVIDAEVVEDEGDSPAPVPAPPRIAPRPEEPSTSGLMDYESALDQLRASAPPPAPQARRRNGNRRG
ncbi:hypothetical protein [Gordonia rubripertincta]|uniref:Uncharacterized protein n=1 Tax=Gordonia rubripertincta TaxID=36822 RepID=A0ABT4MSV6_GORRU|nr:hypothetical protein [Gordonia rubripertincta]MCZ4550095.1 hypothetical protein [Gordonia rubripertincta]